MKRTVSEPGLSWLSAISIAISDPQQQVKNYMNPRVITLRTACVSAKYNAFPRNISGESDHKSFGSIADRKCDKSLFFIDQRPKLSQ